MMHGVSFSNLPLNLQALVLKELEKLPMTVTDLAQVLCKDKGQISNICSSLADAGRLFCTQSK